ncbi:MAG: putative Transcription termination/antitermination factor NusG, partial [Acidobacteriaceae bacterium]|nr:putative Transcription termination/antitermination factor NusG [Acidobacteriaceae bacterium]
MTTCFQLRPIPESEMTPTFDTLHWYAVQTRARHEKRVAQRFHEQGLPTFLPLVNEVHRWSDRKKAVELPLFGCYVFVKTAANREDRLRVCRIDGVFKIVGGKGEGTPIPEEQIEAVRTITSQQLVWSEHPFLKIGQRIRIRSGALAGVEGILTARNGDRTLVVSVDAIQRSLAVRIEGY